MADERRIPDDELLDFGQLKPPPDQTKELADVDDLQRLKEQAPLIVPVPPELFGFVKPPYSPPKEQPEPDDLLQLNRPHWTPTPPELLAPELFGSLKEPYMPTLFKITPEEDVGFKGVAGHDHTTFSGTGTRIGPSNFLGILSDVTPDADSTRDIGSPTRYWALGYFDSLLLNSTASLSGATAGQTNVVGHWIPTTDNVADLGDATHRWRNAYIADLSGMINNTICLSIGKLVIDAAPASACGDIMSMLQVGNFLETYAPASMAGNGIFCQPSFDPVSPDSSNSFFLCNLEINRIDLGAGEVVGVVTTLEVSGASINGAGTINRGMTCRIDGAMIDVSFVKAYGLWVGTYTTITGLPNRMDFVVNGNSFFNGAFTTKGNFNPSTDSLYDLGASSTYWANTYTDKIFLNSTASIDGATAGILNMTGNMKVNSTIKLKEQAAAEADDAAFGQLWVKTATPNQLWFTDDAGTDTQLGIGVPTSRTITTTSPLTGGGDLSANRTFGLAGLSAVGTANYLPGVNAGGTAWEYKQILGVASEIDITHGAGSITIGLVNPLAVTKGGTGLATVAINNILYASALDTIAGLATGNNGVLVTGATGIPAIGTDLPTAVTIGSAYIHRVGGTDVAVADGGTGKSSWTQWLIPYADTTTSFAQIPIGTSGQVLTSNGAGVAPTFQAAAGGAPGGADTQVQFNDAGAFGGDAGLTYDKAAQELEVAKGIILPEVSPVSIPGANKLHLYAKDSGGLTRLAYTDSTGLEIQVDPSYTTKEMKIYPLAAAPVNATSSASAWAWGAWVEIVPVSTITSDFIITGIYSYSTVSQPQTYQVQIGKGAGGAEVSIATVSARQQTNAGLYTTYAALPIPIKVDANTRIAIRATDDAAAARIYPVYVNYIELPL